MARHFGLKSHNPLHLKGGTQGTSNEISFSVLDAKKQAQGGDDFGGESQLGKIALFSLPGTKSVSSTPTKASGLHLSTGEFVSSGSSESCATGLSCATKGSTSSGAADSKPKAEPRELSPEEKAARKKTRRRVFSGVAAVAIIGALAFGVYSVASQYYDEYLSNQSAQEVLTASLSAVVEADGALSQLDGSLENLLGDESLAAMQEVKGKLNAVTTSLDKAQVLAVRSKSNSTDKEDIAAAQAALDAIAARRTMLVAGRSIIDESLSAHEAIETLQGAWGYLLQADNLTREAVKAAGSLTNDELTQATAEAQEALTAFETAKASFALADNAYDELDFSSYMTYADTRIDALYHFIASCAAVIEEDVDSATPENKQYNDLDAKAVQMAAGFPQDISTLVTDKFMEAIKQPVASYTEAVKSTAALDTQLREYLRTNAS